MNKTIISSKQNLKGLFSEIWHSRELFWVFIWRDVKVRYKQTVLGVLWVILQPLMSVVTFTIFFGKLAKIPSGNMPYALFSLIALTFWNFFSSSLSKASDSMVSNESIIKKIYFPRLILPFSAVLGSTLDFGLNFVFLLLVSFFLGYIPNIVALVIVPVLILVVIIFASGLGLILSSVNVRYRDVRYILPFFIQLSMFVSPVIYPLNIVGVNNRYLMVINPMTMVIEIARWLFSGGKFLYADLILISVVSTVVAFVLGILIFKRTEKTFTDIA